MKNLKMVLIVVSVLMLTLVGCKKNDPKPSAEEQQLQLLLGTWKPGSVVVDGTDITTQYTGFKLTFFKEGSETKLSATNPGYAFHAGVESWSFEAGSQGTKILRSSDNVEMNVQVDEARLTLSFMIAPPLGGKTSGLDGQFTFSLTRE